MKRKKLLAVMLTLVTVTALLTTSFSAVSASPNDDDPDPTGHCIEPEPQGMFIRSENAYSYYDFDDEEGWLEFYATEDMEVVGMEFFLYEEASNSPDALTFTGIRAFSPDMELTQESGYKIDLTGEFYSPQAPVSLKEGDVLLHLDYEPFEGFYQLSFRMWNLAVRTPDGTVSKIEYGRKDDADGMPLLRGDVKRDLKVDINDATELQKCLAEYTGYFFITSVTEPSVIDLCLADMDGDRKITIRDVTAIQAYLADFTE